MSNDGDVRGGGGPQTLPPSRQILEYAGERKSTGTGRKLEMKTVRSQTRMVFSLCQKTRIAKVKKGGDWWKTNRDCILREREIWVRKSSGAATMDQLTRVRESSAAVGRVRVGCVLQSLPGRTTHVTWYLHHPSTSLIAVSSNAIIDYLFISKILISNLFKKFYNTFIYSKCKAKTYCETLPVI